MADEPTNRKPHFTARRGFIAATGFGVVSLYGLWAAFEMMKALPLLATGGAAH